MVREAGVVALAAVFLLVGCTKTVGIPGSQIPRLRDLAAQREVEVADEDGDVVTITRRTRLTLYATGLPPIETRPDGLGFSATALRIGSAFEPQAPVLEYRRITRADARVRDSTATLLAIFIPVGILVSIFVVCAAEGGCGPGT